MRATVTPSPIRKGKRRLLSSCAIAAGIVALAHGGPGQDVTALIRLLESWGGAEVAAR